MCFAGGWSGAPSTPMSHQLITVSVRSLGFQFLDDLQAVNPLLNLWCWPGFWWFLFSCYFTDLCSLCLYFVVWVSTLWPAASPLSSLFPSASTTSSTTVLCTWDSPFTTSLSNHWLLSKFLCPLCSPRSVVHFWVVKQPLSAKKRVKTELYWFCWKN